MRFLLRGRTPVVVNVDSAREDDDEYEGNHPQEDHHGGDSCYYIESRTFVHNEYPSIECNDAELHKAVATHHQELNGEFKLQVFQPYVHTAA